MHWLLTLPGGGQWWFDAASPQNQYSLVGQNFVSIHYRLVSLRRGGVWGHVTLGLVISAHWRCNLTLPLDTNCYFPIKLLIWWKVCANDTNFIPKCHCHSMHCTTHSRLTLYAMNQDGILHYHLQLFTTLTHTMLGQPGQPSPGSGSRCTKICHEILTLTTQCIFPSMNKITSLYKSLFDKGRLADLYIPSTSNQPSYIFYINTQKIFHTPEFLLYVYGLLTISSNALGFTHFQHQ